MHWGARGKGAVDKFDEIERHWLFFFGYGALLASLSLLLRFWDLFAIRAVLYPLYIANAPRARYEGYAVRRLPVFQTVTFALNGGLTMAELQMREKREKFLTAPTPAARTVARCWATSRVYE